jgi:hypothetical protein
MYERGLVIQRICHFAKYLSRFFVIDLLRVRSPRFDARFDGFFFASAFDDGGVVFVDDDALSAAEVSQLNCFELLAEVFSECLTTSENGQVLQHCFAAIAKAWGFDSADLQSAAELIDNQGCQRFAVNIFDDELPVYGRVTFNFTPPNVANFSSGV